MKKGFTLIELLAVITILSIILLIAVFSVSSVISNSKNSLHNTQIEQILKAAEYYNSKEGTDDDIQVVSVKTLTEKGYLKNDEVKDPKTGKIIEGVVLIKYNGKKYSYKYREKNICIADASDISTTPGTKYECEVKDGTKYTFYVLSIEGDKINLIMNSNICEDGTVTYTEANNYCRYAWYDDGDTESSNDTNEFGPVTAMTILGNATRTWTNLPNTNLIYDDTENDNTGRFGYTGITIEDGVGYITKKDGTTQTPITLIDDNPIKARLPKYGEVTGIDAKCTDQYESCEPWLVDNLCYSTSDKYSLNSANTSETAIYNITGYWLLSSHPDMTSGGAREITAGGSTVILTASNNNHNGLRPVITVPISFLSASDSN